VTQVVLPGAHGPRPSAWLGKGTPFSLAARVGSGPTQLSVYTRARVTRGFDVNVGRP